MIVITEISSKWRDRLQKWGTIGAGTAAALAGAYYGGKHLVGKEAEREQNIQQLKDKEKETAKKISEVDPESMYSNKGTRGLELSAAQEKFKTSPSQENKEQLKKAAEKYNKRVSAYGEKQGIARVRGELEQNTGVGSWLGKKLRPYYNK